MKKINLNRGGFTLLELLLVIGILVIIAAISQDFFGSLTQGVQIEDNAKTIIYDLRNTRDKAMNGQDDRNWGVHFVNSSSDYYEIFSTPTDYNDSAKVITVTSYLKNNVNYSFPVEGANFDIIFNKISGQVASSSVILNSGQINREIFVQTQGLIN